MAGSPTVECNIIITPKTSIFSANIVDDTNGNLGTFTNNDCSIVSESLQYVANLGTSGAITLNAYNHIYTINYNSSSSNINISLPTQNLYAWSYYSSATFWTDTETPTTASHIYDSYGNDVTSTYVGGERMIESANTSSIRYATDTFSKIPINVSQSSIK